MAIQQHTLGAYFVLSCLLSKVRVLSHIPTMGPQIYLKVYYFFFVRAPSLGLEVSRPTLGQIHRSMQGLEMSTVSKFLSCVCHISNSLLLMTENQKTERNKWYEDSHLEASQYFD